MSSMPDGSLTAPVIGLIGTAIGAAIGFGDTFFTQRSASRLNKEADERRFEAEKQRRKEDNFIKFVETIYEQHVWLLERSRLDRKWDSEPDIPVPPFAKLEAIQMVYFPEFGRRVKQLIEATRAFESFFR